MAFAWKSLWTATVLLTSPVLLASPKALFVQKQGDIYKEIKVIPTGTGKYQVTFRIANGSTDGTNTLFRDDDCEFLGKNVRCYRDDSATDGIYREIAITEKAQEPNRYDATYSYRYVDRHTHREVSKSHSVMDSGVRVEEAAEEL